MDANEDVMACWVRVYGSSSETVGGVEGGEDLCLHGGRKRHVVKEDKDR